MIQFTDLPQSAVADPAVRRGHGLGLEDEAGVQSGQEGGEAHLDGGPDHIEQRPQLHPALRRHPLRIDHLEQGRTQLHHLHVPVEDDVEGEGGAERPDGQFGLSGVCGVGAAVVAQLALLVVVAGGGGHEEHVVRGRLIAVGRNAQLH